VKCLTALGIVVAGAIFPLTAGSLRWFTGASGWASPTANFMPHGYCYLWNPWVTWLNVISDGLITLSYYCIPIILIYFIRKNRDLPFNKIFWMFGTFILACGTTHLLEVWNVWHGSYVLAGGVKAVTAAVSVLTTAMLVPLVPRVISLPDLIHLQNANRELERQIEERRRFDAPIEAPMRRRVAGGLAIAIFLTALLGYSAWRGAQRAEQDAFWVSHTHEVMENIQRTTRHLIETETSARAFELTGEETLLANYENARQGVYKDMAGLRELTADNPNQQKRLDVLELQAREAVAFAEGMIAKRRRTRVYPGTAEALETERLIEAVRAIDHEMFEEENRLLHARAPQVHAGQRAVKIMAVVGAAVGICLWVLAWLAVKHEIGISERARTQLHRLNAELERRVEERTADLQAEIAERERASEARERLAAVVESSDDAIVGKTLDGTITAWNAGAQKVFGYSAEEAVGESISILIPPDRAEEEAEIIKRVRRGESTDHFETVRVRKDGKEIYVSATISPIRDLNGAIIGASKIARDITQRKRAEEELKQSLASKEAALRELADQKFALDQHAIVATTDVQGTITYVNEKFCAISKYSRPELIGQNHRILNSGHHPKEFFREMYHTIANGKVWRNEICNRAKDGSIYWVDTTIVPLAGDDGKPHQYIAIRADVTERKKAEGALKESLAGKEAALKELAHQKFALDQHAIVATTDVQGTITYVNEKFCAISKYSREELIGKNHRILNSGHHPKEFFREMYHTIANGKVWRNEICNRAKGGSIYWVDTTIVPLAGDDGKPHQYIAIRADITERKKAEEALREQAGVLNLAPVMVRDLDSRISLWSKGTERFYGYTAEEAVGRVSHELLLTRFPEPLEQIEKKIAETGAWEGELTHRKKDGSEVVVASVWVTHCDAAGKPMRIMESNTDITARRAAERQLEKQADELYVRSQELLGSREELESQRRMLQSVLDSMTEGLVAVNAEGKFLLWNPAAQKIVGMGAANVAPSGWSQHYGVFMEDTVTPFPDEQNPLARAMRGESSSAVMFLRNPELEAGAWIEVSANPLRNKDGNVCGGVTAFRDITQRRLDEQKIRSLNEELEDKVIERTQQLETANRELEAFTYSVSHDLRAPLRHIAGFSKILSEDFGAAMGEEARRHLQRIEDGVHRMGLLVDELLNLARVGRHAIKLQETNLNLIIEEVISMLQMETTGRAVTWKIAQFPAVMCDAVLIKQVFQNLLANALKFSRTRERAEIAIAHAFESGRIVIAVRDNGVGFNMKYKDKLFGVFQRLHRAEDFEGTGIGLATVQRIVLKHGGKVWAESELDQGATFYFSLEAAGANFSPSPDQEKARQGGDTTEHAEKAAIAGGDA
jgi:PAS domain S-box-containing protein